MKYDRFQFDIPVDDILFISISGSHAYGSARPDSDLDLRAVKMPDVRDVLRIQADLHNVRRLTFDEVDIEIVPIVRWLKILLSGNGNYLENIYQEKIYEKDKPTSELAALIKDYGLSKRFAGHYLGFAKSQKKDFYQKWKAKCLLYTYRVLMSGIVLFKYNTCEYNLYRLMEYISSDYLPALMEKYVSEKSLINDKVKWEMEKEFERLTEILIKYRDESKLPEEPDYSAFDEWLYNYYVNELCRNI